MWVLCPYQENKSKTHLQQNSNKSPDSPTAWCDETCDQSAHDMVSQVTYQSHHLMQYETLRCKRDDKKKKWHRACLEMGRLQQGLESRSSVHSICDTGLMAQLVMGPMRVSIGCQWSWRLMCIVQKVMLHASWCHTWQWFSVKQEMVERWKWEGIHPVDPAAKVHFSWTVPQWQSGLCTVLSKGTVYFLLLLLGSQYTLTLAIAMHSKPANYHSWFLQENSADAGSQSPATTECSKGQNFQIRKIRLIRCWINPASGIYLQDNCNCHKSLEKCEILFGHTSFVTDHIPNWVYSFLGTHLASTAHPQALESCSLDKYHM